ncbi:MAG: triose-phosphate isomerase, partial [Candidatus Thorarchaeota archaeon]|nr:triose-phosphate isomerase [Candidatus Thorarchaeota archaeon]
EVISGSVDQIRVVNKDVTILCGAGISTGDDVVASIRLGAQGVLLASAVAKSDTPGDVLRGLVEPLLK